MVGGWETGEYSLHLALKESRRRIKGLGQQGPGPRSEQRKYQSSLEMVDSSKGRVSMDGAGRRDIFQCVPSDAA